jgi:CRP/FNR family transcriptional regulator, cyclic AMP receptor protein
VFLYFGGRFMARKASAGFSTQAFLTETGPGKTFKIWPPKYIVFSQGDKADAVYCVQDGKVKLTVLSAQGKEAVIGVVAADQFFGEQCLTGQTIRTTTATILEEARVVRIGRGKMIDTLREEPAFSALFMRYILTHSLRVEEDLVDQLFNSSEKRLARVLLLLANFGKKGKPLTTITNVNQAMLADMIGTTRPRVNHFMNKFRKLGFLDYNGTLRVHSSLLNVVLHD